jgi:hypothetical protein
MLDQVRQRLDAIYAEVDAAVVAAGPRCDASGRCCRFREYRHTLFLSLLEAERLTEVPPAPGGGRVPDGCPYQIENLCTARDRRPLGCRIFFCDPSYQETSGAITESALRKLKDLVDEFHLEWFYAPLHVFIQSRVIDSREDPTDNPLENGRVSLPLTIP